jgi:hypothetical protein
MSVRALKSTRVFISHKSGDAGLAIEIKKMILQRCPEKLEVFVSSDAESLRGGDKWSPKIHAELDRADWLVLLYTRASEDWSWCIYETGYFLGRQTSKETRKLAVIHPVTVMIPPPLQDHHSVKAEPNAMLGFLKNVFQPGSPSCHFQGTEEDLNRMAAALCDAVGPDPTQCVELNNRMMLKLPKRKDPAADPMDGATVVLYNDTPRLFGILAQPHKELRWTEFLEHASRGDFDLKGLRGAVADVMNRRTGPTFLEQFRGKDGVGYRPIIFNLEWTEKGAVEIKLMFWAQSTLNEPAKANDFDWVHRILDSALRFRTHIGEQHGNAAIELRNKSSEEKVNFFELLLRDLAELGARSEREGLQDWDRLRRAFSVTQQVELNRIKREWDDAMNMIQDAVSARACNGDPVEMIRPLRTANRDFMLLALARLSDLMRDFRVPGEQNPLLGPENVDRQPRRPRAPNVPSRVRRAERNAGRKI